MNLLDEEIHDCLDKIDSLLIQDFNKNEKWKQEEENNENQKLIKLLNELLVKIKLNKNLLSNSNILEYLKIIYKKNIKLLQNINYKEKNENNLQLDSFSLKNFWKSFYSNFSILLIDNLIENDLNELNKQFVYNEVLDFFLLIENENFWSFYQLIRFKHLEKIKTENKENLNLFFQKLINLISFEINLVCNHKFIQKLDNEFSDFILIYSNFIQKVTKEKIDEVKNELIKTKFLLNLINQLNNFNKIIKKSSKCWKKINLPNSNNQKKLNWDWNDYFIKKDVFNSILNELNKKLSLTINDLKPNNLSIVSIDNTQFLSVFIDIIKLIDQYQYIYINQLKKSFTVIIEVNLNNFVENYFKEKSKNLDDKNLFIFLNTLYFLKKKYQFYNVEINVLNEIIDNFESSFKAKHLFILSLNYKPLDYFISYLLVIQNNLFLNANYDLNESQKLYQCLLQSSLSCLEDQNLSSNDILILLTNINQLVLFTYDNQGIFNNCDTIFQKFLTKVCSNFLYKFCLLNVSLECLNEIFCKNGTDFIIADKKFNWLECFDNYFFENLPFYYTKILTFKADNEVSFIIRPFFENNYKLTYAIIFQLIKMEEIKNLSNNRLYKLNRNRILKAIFNILITNEDNLYILFDIVFQITKNQNINSDSIQLELLINKENYSTKLNQLDWVFSLVKLFKHFMSLQFDSVFDIFLYKYNDLINIEQSNFSHFFQEMNFLITEKYLLDEITEYFFMLMRNVILILPINFIVSLDKIQKTIHFNNNLIFDSLIIHLVLISICKKFKSKLKKIINLQNYDSIYKKIVSNLINWLTFPDDHQLIKHKNKLNEIINRRKLNFIQHKNIKNEIETDLNLSLKIIQFNHEYYYNDLKNLNIFLKSNYTFFDSFLNKQSYLDDLNLNLEKFEFKILNINQIYKEINSKVLNYEKQTKILLNYDEILKQIKLKQLNIFVENCLNQREDFKQESSLTEQNQIYLNNLKKNIYQKLD